MNEPSIVIGWGRFQPPNLGHKLLIGKIQEVMADYDCDHMVFPTCTHDKKRNPLTFEQKVYWLRMCFPGMLFNEDPSLKTIFNVLGNLVEKGYKKVYMVVGEDRANEFTMQITPWLWRTDEKRLRLDHFEVIASEIPFDEKDDPYWNKFKVHSSQLREWALQNDWESFCEHVPNILFQDEKLQMMAEVREGLLK